MPSFPTSLQPVRGSVLEPRNGRVVDYAGDGTARVRSLFAGTKGTFKLKFLLNAADTVTLRDFCDDNEDATISFLWDEDGQTYSTRIGPAGLRVSLADGDGDLRRCELDLVIVA